MINSDQRFFYQSSRDSQEGGGEKKDKPDPRKQRIFIFIYILNLSVKIKNNFYQTDYLRSMILKNELWAFKI